MSFHPIHFCLTLSQCLRSQSQTSRRTSASGPAIQGAWSVVLCGPIVRQHGDHRTLGLGQTTAAAFLRVVAADYTGLFPAAVVNAVTDKTLDFEQTMDAYHVEFSRVSRARARARSLVLGAKY
jgi:hypothetical protein